jgi:cephalosporin hydroxylase
MDPKVAFEQERHQNIANLAGDSGLRASSRQWLTDASKHRYSYNFSWMGRPIIQFPQDIMAMQEVIWQVQPDLIVETGIAHGGSLIFFASMLALLGGDRRVVGIDVDIRAHNREAIEAHPMAPHITMIQGSSVDPAIVDQVTAIARDYRRVLVVLDSNHTHDHVRQELDLYSPLVRQGSYLVVFDTIIEDLPDDFFPDRPWGPGNNPKTAVRQFLQTNKRFVVDSDRDAQLQISVAPGGYLRCVAD